MPVSALVLTLDPALGDVARESLALDPRVTLGEACGTRLPVVTETESLADGEDLAIELARTPGVLGVDVISIDFSDIDGDVP